MEEPAQQPGPGLSRPRIHPIVPPVERRQVAEGIQASWNETNAILDKMKVNAHSLLGEERTTLSRVQSFLRLSERAYKRRQMRQAETLADRALTLARELQHAR